MDNIRTEMHDMSEKIYKLQEKTEKLTNGQRYAAINEIEKSIAPLRTDLHNLEYALYDKQHDEEDIKQQINIILKQINDLEDIKSDLTKRINTETEHTRQELNDKVINFMKEELLPIKEAIEGNKDEVQSLKEDIQNIRLEIIEKEKEREVQAAAKYDKFKWIVTGVMGLVGGLSALFIWLEPTIRILMSILLP